MVSSSSIENNLQFHSVIEKAAFIQQQAAEPTASVWVSASAGTGKTKVLTDRVLNLLLKGVPPRKILCLTYTKAAATEMTVRLFQRFSQWASIPHNDLKAELISLTGLVPADRIIQRARGLFIEVLYTSGGLNIQTIHSFCQSVLQKFPLEARISPHFKIADTVMTQQLLQESLHDLFVESQTNPALLQTLETVAIQQNPLDVAEKLQDLLAQPIGLRALQQQGFTAVRQKMYQELGLSLAQPWADYLFTFYNQTPFQDLKRCISSLEKGGKEDQERAQILKDCLASKDDFVKNFERYQQAFLTQEGQIRARLASKTVQNSQEDLLPVLQEEALRVEKIAQIQKASALAQNSEIWMELGLWIYNRYNQKKLEQSLLDYDDLITKTYELLHTPGLAPFILYKLDGGIHHILVDEAQDTTPLQWALITALVEEFFSGQGILTQNPTLFAVGDFKQSIYSFQGAEPHLFQQMQAQFGKRIQDARKIWRSIDMQVSFRSTPAVLAAVDQIFMPSGNQQDRTDSEFNKIQHVSFSPQGPGLVEIWPLVPYKESDQNSINLNRSKPEELLAQMIALKIRRWIDDKEILASKGRPIQAGDILVLVQRRTNFLYALIRAFKKQGIPTSGLDRLNLIEHIAIQDLLALGRFLLLPEDDLALATILKSPLFGIDEETLFALTRQRLKGHSLWKTLRQNTILPSLQSASEILRQLFKRVDYVSPFHLYADVLYAGGGIKKFTERMGANVHELLEEFLALAQSYENAHESSLQKFLHWFEHSSGEIKRDLAAADLDEVRIMTVHGAKGLQAPIVFLADTTRLPNLQDSFVWSSLGYFLPNVAKNAETDTLNRLKKNKLEKAREEYRRLLYVALTRAEERLHICGWENHTKIDDNCWYQLCRQGLSRLVTERTYDFSNIMDKGWKGTGFYFQQNTASDSSFSKNGAVPDSKAEIQMPDFLSKSSRYESPVEEPRIASHPTNENSEDSYASTPTAAQDRGSCLHKLLEILPMTQPELWHDLALSIAKTYAQQDHIESLFHEVTRILQEPTFGYLFGPSSFAEVPVFGTLDGQPYSTQIDRLIIEDDRILIIDYKSDLNVPTTIDQVSVHYLQQLKIYRHLVQNLYPQKKIETFLLWTAKPYLMPVDFFSIA